MKKTREQKGITLIALIITIVVLIILAVVAINTITSTNLIKQASQAGQTWDNAQANEADTLKGYESYFNSASGDNSGSIIDHVCWDYATSGGYSSLGNGYHIWNDRSCTICGSELEDLSRGMEEECSFINGYCSLCGGRS